MNGILEIVEDHSLPLARLFNRVLKSYMAYATGRHITTNFICTKKMMTGTSCQRLYGCSIKIEESVRRFPGGLEEEWQNSQRDKIDWLVSVMTETKVSHHVHAPEAFNAGNMF